MTEKKKESQFYVKKTCLSQFTPLWGELGQLTKSTDFEQLHGLQLLGTAIILKKNTKLKFDTLSMSPHLIF